MKKSSLSHLTLFLMGHFMDVDMIEGGLRWKRCVEKASDLKFGTNVNHQMYFQETTNWCPCHYIFADIRIFC